MTQENYDRKIQDLKSSIKNPSTTDQELIAKVDRIHTWMDFTKFDGDRLNTDFIVSLGREMRALYSRIFSNEFSTEEDLLEAYENDLSEEAKEVFWGYEVVNDWETRQISNENYEEYIEFLKKPYFTENELKKAYDKSVNQILHSDQPDRMQLLSWVDFRKKYEDRIVPQAGFILQTVVNLFESFNLVYCPMSTSKVYQKEKGIWMGQTEVTQKLFEAVMGWNYSAFEGRPQNPVEQVTWFDCIDFCNKLSELLGLQPCYKMTSIEHTKDYREKSITSAEVTWDKTSNGFRLPTEDEWETCAKAGTQNQWAGTNDEDKLDRYAWHTPKAFSGDMESIKTHPVGELLPNEWGLYDMTGNVQEWCWDRYKSNKDGKALKLGAFRGGCVYSSFPYTFPVTKHYEIGTDYWHHVIGFRICRNFE